MKEGGQEDTLDGMVSLFDDIFIGAVHKESIPETSGNSTDWLVRMQYQIAKLQNSLTSLIDIVAQVANMSFPPLDQEEMCQMNVPEEGLPSEVLPDMTW